ncbi:MAG: type II toxin-antitoxin system RelE/ParE family toxin [Bacillota bacterium]
MLGRHLAVTRLAEHDLECLPDEDRMRVLTALDALVCGRPGLDLRKLAGRRGQWRLRVGNWRVLLERDPEGGVVRVMRVLHRREAYRD